MATALGVLFLLLAGLFSGQERALASSNGTTVLARQKLQTIRANYQAIKRMKTLRAAIEGVNPGESLPPSWLRRVEPAEVCMITNRHEGSPQAPIVLSGKTYYGSCDGCAENLRLNPSVRFARDPYSGRLVDKAEALTFADASGRVWYFESEANKARFLGLAGEGSLTLNE